MDDAQQSQQEPQEDSGLQTPQPDQPVPTEPAPERAHPREPGEHEAEEATRAEEREAQVRDHNERTGGADIPEGGVTGQREEHQARTPDPDQHGS